MLSAGAAPYHCPSTNAWWQVVASSAAVCRWRLWVSIHGLAQAVKTYVLSVVTNFGVTASRANQSCGYAATTKKKRRIFIIIIYYYWEKRKKKINIDDDG